VNGYQKISNTIDILAMLSCNHRLWIFCLLEIDELTDPNKRWIRNRLSL